MIKMGVIKNACIKSDSFGEAMDQMTAAEMIDEPLQRMCATSAVCFPGAVHLKSVTGRRCFSRSNG